MAEHLLSFVTNDKGTMVSIHANLSGLDLLIDMLGRLRNEVAHGNCEDAHLFTDNESVEELTSSRLVTSDCEKTVAMHVKFYAWTDEWAKHHKLLNY